MAGMSAFFNIDYAEEGGESAFFNFKESNATAIANSFSENIYNFIKNTVADALDKANPSIMRAISEAMQDVADQMRNQGDYSGYTGMQSYDINIQEGAFKEAKTWSIFPLTERWLKSKERHGGEAAHLSDTGDLFDYSVYEYIKVHEGIQDDKGYSVDVDIDIPEGTLEGYKLITYGKKHETRDFFPLDESRQEDYGVMGIANTLLHMFIFNEVNMKLSIIYKDKYEYEG